MRKGVSLLLLLGMLTMCGLPARGEESDTNRGGAWLVYWDVSDGLYDLQMWEDPLDSLIFFAAYFDAEGRLFLPEELDMLREGVDFLQPADPPARILSVTNDQVLAQGGSSQKNGSLLRSLFASGESRAAHARELVEAAQAGDYDGLEIDYEGLGKDEALWKGMLAFLRELSPLAQEAGLSLRVLMEPGAPFAGLDFPPEITYVVMCYNLFGTHSGPGPKATPAFLQELVAKTRDLPGTWGYALASGGFDWAGEGRVDSVTYKQVQDILCYCGAQPQRDAESGCLYFQYVDEEGVSHEVWYADPETLTIWKETLRALGDFQIDLWRLGGDFTGDE